MALADLALGGLMGSGADNLERLRPALAEWERGNFGAGGEILSPELEFSAFNPEGTIRCRGLDELGRYLPQFLAQWERYRIEVIDVRELGESAALVSGRQHGIGKQSGVEIAAPLYIACRFERDRVVGMHWHTKREGALAAAGISSPDD